MVIVVGDGAFSQCCCLVGVANATPFDPRCKRGPAGRYIVIVVGYSFFPVLLFGRVL